MGIQSHYERDASHSGAVVAAKWRAIWVEVQSNMTCCQPGLAQNNTIIYNEYINTKIIMLQLYQMYVAASLDVSVAFPGVPDDYDADPGDAGAEIAQRDLALCVACKSWVDTMCNSGMSFLESAVSDVVPVAAGAIALPIIPLPISVFIGLLTALYTAVAYIELSREDYRQYLACGMYDALQGASTATQVGFDAAFDSLPARPPPSETGAQDQARDLIESWFRAVVNDLENWLAFVSVLDAAMSTAGTMPTDSCLCGTFTHVFDFTIDDGGWVNRSAESRPYGVYVAGVGWESVYAGAAESLPDDERLYMERVGWDDRSLTQIRFYYTTTGGGLGAQDQDVYTVKAGGVEQDTATWLSIPVPSTFVRVYNMTETVDEIETAMTGDCVADTAMFRLTKVIVYGIGTDPF